MVNYNSQFAVPEPATLSLLALGGRAMLRRCHKGMTQTLTSKPDSAGGLSWPLVVLPVPS